MTEKTYTLGVYEKAMPDSLSINEKLIYAKEAGFDFLEISIDESDGRLARLKWSDGEIKELADFAYQSGISIDTMCLSGHRKYPIGSLNPETRERGLEIMQDAVFFAKKLGIRIIQLAGYDVYYEESSDRTRELFEINLAKCTEMAAAAGIMLGFETMETDFMNTIAKAKVHVDRVNSPYLKIYPDIGNVTNATEDVKADIFWGAGDIAAAHLKETVEGVFRDLMPGEGRVDFITSIDSLIKVGVRKFNAEFWYREGDDWKERLSSVNRFYRNIISSSL